MRKPCENPNCKSYGKPHPNCKCEGAVSFAEGGEVDLSNFDALPDDSAKQAQATKPLMFDELKDDSHKQVAAKMPAFDDLTDDSEKAEKYGSLGQQIITGIEGTAQGLAGPLATLAETKLLGVKPEDIKGRAEANPWTHGITEGGAFAASMLYGVGEAGLIAKGAGALAKSAKLGKMGSLALKGAIEAASFTTSDEITKVLLGQPGDPEIPVGAALLHVGAAGAMGAVTAGLFTLGEGLIGKGLEKLGSDKMVKKAQDYLMALAKEGDPLGKLGVTQKVSTALTDSVAVPIALKIPGGLIAYPLIRSRVAPLVEKITGKAANKANPYVTDAVIKALVANETSGIPNAVHYAIQVGKGVQKAMAGIEAVFKAGSSQVAGPVSEYAKEQLKQFIEDGQVDQQAENELNTMQQEPQAFAKGGLVGKSQPNSSFANIFPEQNTLLNSAKGRISGYLNSIRPLPNESRLPFDEKPSVRQKEKDYHQALDLAVNPLKILDKMNSGKLTPEDMKHFTSMYPEVHRYLSGALTKRIIKAQLDGEKPPYGKRQSMSLFLGAALDSTLTPMAIQAAQGVFQKKKMAKQNQVQQKGQKKAISKAGNAYLTDDQSVQKRQQKV